MAALNTFVQNYLPLYLRQTRDFTGGRGWVHLANQVLRRIEREGMFPEIVKEIGVEVSSDYYITPPSDFRKVIEISYPPIDTNDERDKTYSFDYVNQKIKLEVPFDKDAAPDAFTLSAGGASSVVINDTDATEDEHKDKLLVLTNGTYSGDTVLIQSNTASGSGTCTLTFALTRTSITGTTAGYLTSQYLMLKYQATYTPFAAHTDEIPLETRYEDLLANGLASLACKPGSEDFNYYKALFEDEIAQHKTEAFTPTPDQARPMARSIPAFEDADAFDRAEFDYIGDED